MYDTVDCCNTGFPSFNASQSELNRWNSSIFQIDHSSHCNAPGVVLTVGEGDVGQLGLGPDTMERMRMAAVDLPGKSVQVST